MLYLFVLGLFSFGSSVLASEFVNPTQMPCGDCVCSRSEEWGGIVINCSLKEINNLKDALDHVDLDLLAAEPVHALDFSGSNLLSDLTASNKQLCTRYPHLKSVSLAQNGLNELGSLFMGCKELHKVNLTGNVLKKLHSGNFQGMDNLKSLMIETDVGMSEALRVLSQMQQLSVIYHGLSIEEDVFNHFGQLEALTLVVTKSSELPLDLFDLPFLKMLTLTGIKVKELSESHFSSLVNLETLSLNIPSLDNSVVPLVAVSQSLKSLTITNMRELMKINGPTSLQTLSLNKIDLMYPDIFGEFLNLKTLDLVACSVSSVPPNWFEKLTSLKNLDLSSNQISQLDTLSFSGLSKLQNLNLAKNKLTEITDEVFDPLSNSLMFLKLQGNFFRVIGKDTFKGLSSLMVLDLSFNKIANIADDAFGDMTNLNNIYLQGNSLSELDSDLFSHLQKLQLDLSGNAFKQIPEAVLKTDILTLKMNQNRVPKLDGDTLCQMTNLEKLGLVDNPIACNCSERDLLDCLPNLIQVQGKCSAPDELRDQNIASFECFHLTTTTTAATVTESLDLLVGDVSEDEATDESVLPVNHDISKAEEGQSDESELQSGNATSADSVNESEYIPTADELKHVSEEDSVVSATTTQGSTVEKTESTTVPTSTLPTIVESVAIVDQANTGDDIYSLNQLPGENDGNATTLAAQNQSNRLLGHKNESEELSNNFAGMDQIMDLLSDAGELVNETTTTSNNETNTNKTAVAQDQKDDPHLVRKSQSIGVGLSVLIVILVMVFVLMVTLVGMVIFRNCHAGHYNTLRHGALRGDEPLEPLQPLDIQMQTFDSAGAQ